jgi:hypothetical protein
VIGLLAYLGCWLVAVDAIRRSSWQWTSADRDKTFWVIMLILFGPLFVIPYLLAVLPRLLKASSDGAAPEQFVKQPRTGETPR